MEIKYLNYQKKELELIDKLDKDIELSQHLGFKQRDIQINKLEKKKKIEKSN